MTGFGTRGRRALGAVAAAAAALLSAEAARAVVIHDAAAGQELALAQLFPSVARVQIGGGVCSGALISPTTVLSAEHCFRNPTTGAPVTASVTVSFRDAFGTVTASRATSTANVTLMGDTGLGAPSFGSVPSNLLNGSDLAIVSFATPVLDRDPFLLLADPAEAVGAVGVMVGYGRFGVGSSGAPPGTSAEPRAATNLLEAYGPAIGVGAGGSGPFLGVLSGTANIFTADFDDPSNPPVGNTFGLTPAFQPPFAAVLEGLIAPGDSGGPLLVQRGGDWVIAGIASGLFDLGGGLASYGDLGYWTGVSTPEARAFVTTFGNGVYVPLPAAGWMLLAAVGALAAGRRRAA